MSDLLIELFSEEIPARMQEGAEQNFARLLTDRLKTNDLTFANCETFSTPRRLSVHVTGLLAERPRRIEEIKGPKTEAPAQALEGFLKKNGITDISACAVREVSGVPYYFYDRVYEGARTADILGALIAEAIASMTWPKSMRWGHSTLRWARPLHNVLALLDGAVVKGEYPIGPGQALTFNNLTWGHRFMSDGKDIPIAGFSDYQMKLAGASVILNRAERRRLIWDGVQKIATAAGLTAKADEKLLDEVVGLVEFPVPFMGTFDKEFLEIPPEVVTTSMREHQRYFSLLTPEGKLANRFICVANLQPDDAGKTLIYGNEKVLRARLSDARFFWDQDRKIRLEEYLPRLKEIRFHEKLGSMAQKAERLAQLSAFIAGAIGADGEKAARAALLCKADLVTGMVREFPELQGVMGGYYARRDGEPEEVCRAISDHYTPAGPSDKCPTDKVAVAVALADKIDTLVGFFSIDERPTGSKDPFALRRAALGIIRIILENNLKLSLSDVLGKSTELYQAVPSLHLQDFIMDRFKGFLRDQGLPHNLIEAGLSGARPNDLTDLRDRVRELAAFVDTESGKNLAAAMGRVLNILKAISEADMNALPIEVLADKLTLPEERALVNVLSDIGLDLSGHMQAARYGKAMTCLAGIRPQVDAFFDKVIVNDNDPAVRRNRLAILVKIRTAAGQIADFSKL